MKFDGEAVVSHWKRSQWGMTAVVFIAFFGFNFVQPILPLYVRQLGVADVSQAALLTGLMLAVSPLLAAFCSPLWGLVADRFGRKRMVQRSLLVFAVASSAMGLVSNVAQLFALRAAIGVFGGFTSMTMAYIVAIAPPARASAALGLLQSAQVAGLIVGPLCAGLVADRFGLRASFFGGAAVIVVGFVAASLLTQDERRLAPRTPGHSSQPPSGPGLPTNPPLPPPSGAGLPTNPPLPPPSGPGLPTSSSLPPGGNPLAGVGNPPATARPDRPPRAGGLPALRAATRLPGFLSAMVILFLAQFVDRSFGPILPLYVASLGTPPDQVASYAGLIVSLGAVGTAVSATTVGQLATRLPAWRLLLVTLVAGAALCLPMALVHAPTQLLLARTLLGFFAGGTLTLAYSLANQAIPAESKGAAFGVLSSTTLLGSASSPLITGALTRIDLRAVFVLDSLLYAFALVWVLRAARRT